MTHRNIYRRLERLEARVLPESTVPDLIHVQLVEPGGGVVDSFLIDVQKRARGGWSKPTRISEKDEPVQDHDNPRTLQESIELNTKTYRQWLVTMHESSDEDRARVLPGRMP